MKEWIFWEENGKVTIELKSVSKIIRKIEVIKDVSLSMESGKVYGLKGVNGSGKTMLMRLISGLIRPTSGTIRIDGKVLGKDIEETTKSEHLIV